MKKQNQFVQAIKCCLTNGKFALILFISVLLFSSCNKELSRKEATRQLEIVYNGDLVVEYSHINIGIMEYLRLVEHEPNSSKLKSYFNLMNSGLLLIGGDFFGRCLELSDEGLKYCNQQKNKAISCGLNEEVSSNMKFVTNTLKFKSVDKIFMNSENTATVDIKLERNGITPFGEFLGYKKGDLVSKQIQFNRYDNGWQMNSSENRVYASQFSFFKNGEYVPSISQNISTEGLDDEQETEAEIVKNEQEVKETTDDLNKQVQQMNLPTEINK